MAEMRQERRVKVGIVKAEKVCVVFHSEYVSNGSVFVGECVFDESVDECLFTPVGPNGSFTLKDVVIGVDFHWERYEAQTFHGALQLLHEDGVLRAVNVVPVETYLTSVISSEMSAEAPLEFLKAHAVISRSWLLATMQKTERRERSKHVHEQLGEGGVLRWYDGESHTLFDVCADDHCQRYQGITRQSNPHVVKAIEATCGQVLMFAGEVCDARFSKCCGGMTERFESCWEPVSHPYLVVKHDPYCGVADRQVLSRVLNSYDRETSDFYRWTVRFSVDELSELVARKSGIDFGRIIDLVPVERGASGRVVLLKIVGEKRTLMVGKELEIRKWLSESHLYSSAFDVEKTADGFVLHGKGWGHGVGLCQIGAAVMGDRGLAYEQILDFYYPNAELTKLW